MKIKTIKKALPTIFLLIILALALVVRIYNIENVPSGVYPDEAVNGMDALHASQTGDYRWFYTDNNGREGLFINLIALSYRLFGVTILGLKFPSIIFGFLTVWGTYLLTKELFRSRRAAFLTAIFVAFSFWSINFSRIAFRAIMLPPILTFSFYFLFKGIRNNHHTIKTTAQQYFLFALAGFIFGIGLHTYIAWRIAPGILIILFFALWITKKHFLRDYWLKGLVFIIFMFISMAPLLLTFNQHPEYLTSRSGEISIFSPEMNHGHLIKTALKSLSLSLVKYTFWGDQNWRHNYPPYPILNPILGITFLIGLIYLITKWFHLLFLRFKHKIRDRKFYVYSFLLAWFFAMLSPEFLTAEGLPHALRSIGTLPVVYIIATIPFLWILGKYDQTKFKPLLRLSVSSLLIFTVVIIVISNIIKYHYFWANNSKQAQAFEADLIDASDYLQDLPKNKKKIVVAGNMQIVPIKLFNYSLPHTYRVHQDNLDSLTKILPNNEYAKNYVFILTDKQRWVADKLVSMYPELKFRVFERKNPNSNNKKEVVWTVQK